MNIRHILLNKTLGYTLSRPVNTMLGSQNEVLCQKFKEKLTVHGLMQDLQRSRINQQRKMVWNNRILLLKRVSKSYISPDMVMI